ncbi:MAG: hypothetical protein AAGI66_07315 [Cyanobacteria bacterium P01_H01_bin.74]
MPGFKFFKLSHADIYNQSALATISNNEALIQQLFNRDEYIAWESIGSNDDETIVLEIDFGSARTFDCLILNKTNLKAFNLEYFSGSWVTLLTVSDNLNSTYYGKFPAVTATLVRLSMIKTVIPNAEKTIQDVVITEEIGQLVGYPALRTTFARTKNTKELINGKNKFLQKGRKLNFTLSFVDHVGTNDRALFHTVTNLSEPFLLWPCGGNVEQFAYPDFGYRLEDLFLVQVDENGYSHEFTKNLYKSGFRASLRLKEA